MIFLPIVARELRVASRRRATFIIRGCVALLGIAIGGTLLFLLDFFGQSGGQGQLAFGGSALYLFLIALLAGIFLASDSLSEERREGTLGFLFLTDLKGYDVVLGKFAGVSLNAFYGILAVFPILAVSFLAGGVSASEFWRTCLALVNALFFSVASSIWVSSLCKSASRAMGGAFCLQILMLVLGKLVQFISPMTRISADLFYLGALSPVSAFHYGFSAYYLYGAASYWKSLAVCNAAGWLFLGLAAWRLRFFRETAGPKTRREFVVPALVAQKDRRCELLDINPVLWLLDDSRRLRWMAWAIAVGGGAIMMLVAATSSSFGIFAITYVGWPIYFVLKVFFAIQACRFFTESRRNGAMELLCCTPLKMRSIVSGQWLALSRIFLWPIIVLVLCQLACLCFLGQSIASFLGATAVTVTSGGKAVTSAATPQVPNLGYVGWYPVLMILKQIANSVADFFALGWFGMWLAISLQKPATATALTILYVLVLPAIAFCVPTLATDAVFIVVGYSKLQQDFRLLGMTAKYQSI